MRRRKIIEKGFRLIVKVLAGDDRDSSVREFLSTAIAAWAAVDRLHDVYLRDADKHPGQLPVVELVDVIETKERVRHQLPAGIADRELDRSPGRHAQSNQGQRRQHASCCRGVNQPR